MASSTFAAEVLADGPIGYWRLGDLTAADTSGNRNDGAASGGVTFGQPGLFGGDTAALFDGRTGRIIVENSNSLNPPHITMEAKVRWDGPNDLYQRILEKSSFPQLAQYGLGILPDGHVRVELRTSSATTSVDVDSNAFVTPGAETHVVATYDGDFIRIYLNGHLDSETRAPGSISPKPPTPFNLIESGVGIGNQTQRDRPFNGLIDEVALYPRAMSPERVLAHYQSQFVGHVINQYAAKFVCGKSSGKVVAPGVYFTAVNVHNPGRSAVDLAVKVAVALPGLQAGPVSKFHNVQLGPDEALEIDCSDISEYIETKEEFLKGFVVIESESDLDVVTVYTAMGREESIETLHIERVPSRQREVGAGEVCVGFEPPLTEGTQYGAPAGHTSGDEVLMTSGIALSVHEFSLLDGSTTFNVASIEMAPVAFGSGQSIRLTNIDIEFDFTTIGFAVREVSFDFLDLGGYENLAVNGSQMFVGDLASIGNVIDGVNVSVSTSSVSGGQVGRVVLTGAMERVRVGGQELWIDNVCARAREEPSREAT